MYKEVIEKEWLTCTELEFETYLNWIDLSVLSDDINSQIIINQHTFDELYNWIQIENIANWKYYYTCEIYWRIFLQNIEPFVGWYIWLDDSNIDKVILTHKTTLLNDYILWEKFNLTLEYFKNLWTL